MLDDPNHERRNLTVTSFCFIVYFLAGGEFRDSEVTLLVINIQFTKPHILAFFAWGLLFWSALRYWQAHRNKIRVTFNKELEETHYFVNSKLVVWYVERKTGKEYKKKNGFVLDKIIRMYRNIGIRIGDVVGGKPGDGGLLVEYHSNKFEEIKIDGISGFILKIYLCAYLAITKPGFGSYFVPYLLFSTAIVLGVFCGLIPYIFELISNSVVIPAQAGIQ